MKSPDYGFTNGLNLERVAHLASAGYEDSKLGDVRQIATADDMQRMSTESYTEDRITAVIEQVRHPRYIRSLGGVGFEAAVLSGGLDADTVKFHLYGWGGNLRHPNAQREAIALAYSDPDAAHVFINGPGVGNSGMLPKEAQDEIRRTGSYAPLGEYLAPVAEHIAKDYDTVVMGGHSLGARTATGIATHMQPGLINELRLHDPTGTQDMSLLRIGSEFIVREGLHNAKYVKESMAPSAKEVGLRMLSLEEPVAIEVAERALLSPHAAAREFAAPEHGWRQQFLVDPYGLRLSAFEGDLHQAAPNIERAINIIVPDMSRLNDWRAIRDIVGRMRSLDGLRANVSQWNLLGHTHANMNQPASLAAIYSAEL